MNQHAVRRWRDALLDDIDSMPASPLSRAGAQAALHAALASWTDDALRHIAHAPGRPYSRAAIVAPRTVITAPLEWCAGWLLTGASVVWKHPQGLPGLSSWAARHASSLGLDLRVTDDRAAVEDVEVIVAMGSEPTIHALREAHLPQTRILGFGHRFSAAWWPADAPVDPDALAADLLLHDGRGCMTPALILTPQPDEVLATLAPALTSLATRWSPGTLSPHELAQRRARRDLARMVGAATRCADVDLLRLPAAQASPAPLPRSVTVIAADHTQAQAWLAPHAPWLSTLVQPDGAAQLSAPHPHVRVATPGQAQRPPLLRAHDGVPTMTAWRATGSA